MAEADRQALSAFIGDLHDLLDRVVEDPRDLIYDEHHDDLRRAWIEISERGLFQELQNSLRKPALGAAELDTELELRGLTGAQLEIKLRPFYYWLAREVSVEVATLPEPGRRPSKWFRRALNSLRGRRKGRPSKWFRRALNWANIPLGTLASIAGIGAVADPVKEIKDVFLEASEDREG